MDAEKRQLVWLALASLLACAGTAHGQSDRSATASGATASRDFTDAAVPTQTLQELRYVSVDRAEVYAGPSEGTYPTAHLERGQTVEVYQRTPEGWLAIRPPQGSFSWLPAAQALLMPGGRVAEVTDASAVSWIGTSLGSAKQYRWQVRLSRGEQLAVVGEQSISDSENATKTLWYKITPPNGEFRWIPERDTTLDRPVAATTISDATVVTAGAEAAIDPSVDEDALREDPSSRSVLAASFDEITPTDAASPMRSTRSTTSMHAVPGAYSDDDNGNFSETNGGGGDRWNNWHAIDFSNGSLSFPGFARMLGMEPRPASTPQSTYDPFDLASGPARARPHGTANTRSGAPGRRSVNGSPQSPTNDPTLSYPNAAMDTQDPSRFEDTNDPSQPREADLASNSPSQRWRDPRSLRQERERTRSSDASGIAEPSGDSSASGWIARHFSDDRSDDAVGTGVVAAVAMESNSDARGSASTDADWYGIEQAPASGVSPSAAYQPVPLSQAELGELQLRLSEIVSGSDRAWDLAPLAERTRYLIENGESAIERGEARLLMDRIEAFADLARRSAELGGEHGAGLPSQPSFATTSVKTIPASAVTSAGAKVDSLAGAAVRWASPLGVSGQAIESSSGNAPRFDATGWIVPVHTSGRDMPTHALTNDAGKIIVYLSPAAGVNLARYQAQAVGVYGLRGYLPQLKANHIQVQRAIRLQ